MLQTLVRLRDRRVASRFADGRPRRWALPPAAGPKAAHGEAGMERKAA
jgi:hypothetical protein